MGAFEELKDLQSYKVTCVWGRLGHRLPLAQALCRVGWLPSHRVGPSVPILQVRQMRIKVAWLLELGFQSPTLVALEQLSYVLQPHPCLLLSVSRS